MSDKDAREEATFKYATKAQALGEALNKLRAGTGPAIEMLLVEAFNDGFLAAESQRTQAPSEQSAEEFLRTYLRKHHGSIAGLIGTPVVCDILKSYARSLAGTQAQAAQWISVKACACCGCLEGKCIHDGCSVCGGKFGAPVAALEGKETNG